MIQNENHYEDALHRVYELMEINPDPGTKEFSELEMLSTLVEAYEELYHSITPSDPVEYLKYKMVKMNIKQNDLVPILGSKYTVSKIMNKKQGLTLDAIKKLSVYFHIPVVRLIGI
jgi:HTH-type transcriptional regulator/antitoxin HigA